MALLALHSWCGTTLMFLLIVMQLGGRVNTEPTGDKQALLDFIAQIPHEERVHWNATESACNWFGVQCDASQSFVESLHLSGVGLVGPIPPNTIGRLTQLRALSLRHNALTGEIPADFSNLTHLRNLYLQNNNFSCDFPISLIGLSRLARLDLSLNNFAGSIPFSINNLTHLTGLFLQSNQFSGNLPSITTKLLNFNVSNNGLNGSIPESLINFPVSSFAGNVDLCGGMLKTCNPSRVPSGSPMQSPSLSPLQSPSSIFPPVVNAKSKNNSGGIVVLLLVLLFGHPLVVCSVVVALLVVLILFLCFCCRSSKPPQAVVEEGTSSSRDDITGSAGSLFALLHGNRESGRRPLDWNTRMRIAIGTARDLAFSHVSRKLVHGNLNSSNILFSQNLDLDPIIFQNSSTQDNHLEGYQAPELLETQQPTFQSDVYSFGVLLLELLTGKAPNQESLSEERKDLPHWVQSVVREEWTTEVFDEELLRYRNNEEEMVQLLTIAMKCVFVLPDQRPTMQEVVRMIEAINHNHSQIDEGLSQSSKRSDGYMPRHQSTTTSRSDPSYFLTNKGKVLLKAEKWGSRWVGGSS